jgi:tagatose-6-phosphate ketose/aldose isomerase
VLEVSAASYFGNPHPAVDCPKLFDSPFTFVYFTIAFHYFRLAFCMNITAQWSSGSQEDWLSQLAQAQRATRELLEREEGEQRRLGYFHTLREICQQPATWLRTAELMREHAADLGRLTHGLSCLTLSGSGSSEYAGDCVRPALRKNLGINVQAVASGALLTLGVNAMPVGRPSLMVSLARSGDSPESVGALSLIRKLSPDVRHLILTCNRQGRLANESHADPNVTVITLEDATNDRSLVMTSSFTNMALAGLFLGFLGDSVKYASVATALARGASKLLQTEMDALAQASRRPFRRVMFLGSGAHFPAAREASLKMLEMTGGRVVTGCETYLGLRHGPMSSVHDDTSVVCFLSVDPMVRAYEADVVRELARKRLGLFRILVGQEVPPNLPTSRDVVIPFTDTNLADEDLPILDVVVGQLLAFFRCLHEGLRPDIPSENGVIHRVVQAFTLHLPRT